MNTLTIERLELEDKSVVYRLEHNRDEWVTAIVAAYKNPLDLLAYLSGLIGNKDLDVRLNFDFSSLERR